MKYLSILILLFGLSCSSAKKTTKTSSNSLSDNASIHLERGGCYGTCPIYSLTIYTTGEIAYTGKAYVDNIGKFEGQIDNAIAQKLLQKVSTYDWKSYPDKFPIDNVDFPSFTFVYTNGDYTKKVKGNSRAAEELIALTKEMDLLIKDIELK